jgi:putative hemolysin
MSGCTDIEVMFNLISPRCGHSWMRKARLRLNALLMKLTGLAELKNLYLQVRADETGATFVDKILKHLGVDLDLGGARLEAIPATGPLVVVANHPFGGVEAAVLASLLLTVRPDVKFLANNLLSRIAELENLILPVDPFHSRLSTQVNLVSIKRAIQWVRSGGVLAVFPAGEVAHYQISRGRVTESKWQASIGQLIRSLKAPVLPVFFAGKNSLLFQLGGLLHPRLRTGLLVHEFLNKRGRVVSGRIGHPIPFERLKAQSSNEDLMEYLGHRTHLLAFQKKESEPSNPRIPLSPIIPSGPREILQQEVESLPAEQRLVRSGEMEVLFAGNDQIPRLMQEIGRLREVTFRAVGEGSGGPFDLDEFDKSYLQLFIWNRRKAELAGAYRMGLTDLILNRQGHEGFYTRTLFEYPQSFVARISPGIELGRSFVCPDYQRSYLPLLLLWRGIGKFLAQRPWYRYLFGPVSMSSSYRGLSRQLLVSYLSHRFNSPDLAPLVRARNPAQKECLLDPNLSSLSKLISGIDELSDIISDMEPDAKGLPVLFQKYLELGGRLLAFNIDPHFSNALDGLILVDLPQADRRLLEFYMGKTCAAQYLMYHQEMARLGGDMSGRQEGQRKSCAPEQNAKGLRPAIAVP